MDIIKSAFVELYPKKEFSYTTKIIFSNHFSMYNASIVKRQSSIEVRASGLWKDVAQDILFGLVQTLLVKFFGPPENETYNMKLYDQFLKNVHLSIPKKDTDKELEESFNRVGEQFLSDTVELSNLKWGTYSTRKLGSYDFQTDTIVISKALQGKDQRMLDYVMFHEMLHKKLKFSTTKSKKHFHTSEFHGWEKRFPQHEEIENELKKLGRKASKKNLLSWIGERFK